jgi:hypothetical protein
MRFTPSSLFGQHLVGRGLHGRGDVGARRPAVGRVVLEAAALGRVVRRRDDDAVGQARGSAAVVDQDGVRHGRRGRVFVVLRDHQLDAVGRQHLDRAVEGRRGQRVRVDAQEQRAVDAFCLR